MVLIIDPDVGGPKVAGTHLNFHTFIIITLQFLFRPFLRRALSNPAFREVKVYSFSSVKILFFADDDSGLIFMTIADAVS